MLAPGEQQRVGAHCRQSRRHQRQINVPVQRNRGRADDPRRLVELDRYQLRVLLQDQNRERRGEHHLCCDDRPKVVRQPIAFRDAEEWNRQKRRRQHVGQERGVGQQPRFAQLHSFDRKARQRADEHRQERGRHAEIQAVAELAPEILEVPISLGYDDPKAFERRVRRPDITGELVITFGIERDQEHVVNRQERPDQQHDAEHRRGRFGEEPAHAVARPVRRPTEGRGDAHN